MGALGSRVRAVVVIIQTKDFWCGTPTPLLRWTTVLPLRPSRAGFRSPFALSEPTSHISLAVLVSRKPKITRARTEEERSKHLLLDFDILERETVWREKDGPLFLPLRPKIYWGPTELPRETNLVNRWRIDKSPIMPCLDVFFTNFECSYLY